MQPQQTQSMYIAPAGNANNVSIRANQQPVYRGPPVASPTPRSNNARQVSMPNICQQQMHAGYVLPPFGAFTAQRQPSFQNPQPYPFPHGSVPPSNFFYPNPMFMQTPMPRGISAPGVNGGIVQTTNTVPMAVSTTGSQPSIPINSVVGAGPSGGLLSVTTTQQVTPASLMGIVPNGMSSHPTQTLQTAVKQPKPHPNRMEIIDPKTKLNILDYLDVPKATANQQQSVDGNPSNESYPPVGGCVIGLTDPIPNITYDINTLNIQRDTAVSYTPIVSANTDAPSVEILPTACKNRTQRIESNSPSDDEGILGEVEIVNQINVRDVQVDMQIDYKENTDIPVVDNADSNLTLEQASAPTLASELKSSIHAEDNTLQSKYFDPNQCEDILKKTIISDIEPTALAIGGTFADEKKVDELSFSLDTGTEYSNAIINKSDSPIHQIVASTTVAKKQDMDVAFEGDTKLIKEEKQNAKNDISNKDSNETENIASFPCRIAPTSNNKIEKELEKHEAQLKENESELHEENNQNAQKIEKENIEQSNENFLITYEEGQWSPNNPFGKRQYKRDQLLKLRNAKASQVQPTVKNTSILPQSNHNLLPNFVQKTNHHKRVQSMMGAIGGTSGSHRVGDGMNANSYGGKQTSMSGVNNRNSSKGEKIQINLSLNQDVKLNETDNAWKPRILQRNLIVDKASLDPEAKAKLEKEELIRKVRGILNKLTPEKFETLVEEIFKLKFDTYDKMEDVMVLVFEKAIDEPNFSESYADLCNRLIKKVKDSEELEKGTKTNLAKFRTALIDKTEREFNQNVTGTAAKDKILKPIMEKIRNSSDPLSKAELEIQLEEEERKIRRRSVGTVRFIGELYKLSILNTKIIYTCINNLFKGYNEDLLECLCKLLTTVGAVLEKSKPLTPFEKTISRMQAIANKSEKGAAKISSRVRFMLQDVIDLRKRNWQLTRNEAPKTMIEIEKDAKAAQYLNSLSSGTAVGPSHNKRNDSIRFDSRYNGSHSQRGGANNDSSGNIRRQGVGGGSNSSSNYSNDENGWHVQTGKGSRITPLFDTNKLEMMATQSLETKNLGNISQFVWPKQPPSTSRSSATTTISGASNSFAELSHYTDSDRDRDRERNDRSGHRSKGSFNKNSIERERYGGLNSRSLTSQNSRENSSSRNNNTQGGGGVLRNMNNNNVNSSSSQKCSSQTKFGQTMTTRVSTKPQPSSNTFMSGSNTTDAVLKADHVSGEVIFKKLTQEEAILIKTILMDMLEAYADSTPTNYKLIMEMFDKVKISQYCGFIYFLLADYLHLREVCSLKRTHLANIMLYLLKSNVIKVEHFKLAYKHFCELVVDLLVDIPEVWLYIFDFYGPLLAEKYITFPDLWIEELVTENKNSNGYLGNRFLKAYLNCYVREFGPNGTRSMWKKYNLKWTLFLVEKDVDDFIINNNFDFLDNETKTHVATSTETKEALLSRVLERIDLMLKDNLKAEAIIDYINGNIRVADKFFVRSLTTVLCKYAIAPDSYKLDTEKFKRLCVPVLLRYIDSKDVLELECLIAMQLLVTNWEHPRGLLSELFFELYTADVIPQETFLKWRDSKDQSGGKGVAVKGLNQFFCLISAESSDENL